MLTVLASLSQCGLLWADMHSNKPSKPHPPPPDGTLIRTRVTRRAEDMLPDQQRIETSEFFEQVFQSPNRPQPRVKASQCFTKYRYREVAERGAPLIVATQVVSDYLTPYDDAALLVAARGRPVVVYTYRMAFFAPTEAD